MVALFRSTQNTIFLILVVDTFAVFAVLGTEIEVAMEVENEHLAEIPHLGLLRVRGEGTKKRRSTIKVPRLSGAVVL